MYTQTTCISSFFKGIPNNHDQINVHSSLDFIDQKSNDSSAREDEMLAALIPKWNDKILSVCSSTNYLHIASIEDIIQSTRERNFT